MPQQEWPRLQSSSTRLGGWGRGGMGTEKKGVSWGVGIGKVKVQQENFRGHWRLSQSSAANFRGLGTKYPDSRVRDSNALASCFLNSSFSPLESERKGETTSVKGPRRNGARDL